MRFLSQLKRQSGFSLAEVMIAAAVMGGLALVAMQMTIDQTKLASKSELDSDLTQVNAQIMSYLTSPNHCNANFYGKPLTGSPTAVYTCGVATCHGSGEVSTLPKVTGGTSSIDALWETTTTKISTKVRISNISYTVPTVTGTALSTLTYNVTFQTRLDARNTTSSTMKTVTKKFLVPVVVSGTTISGCPKSWNSTVVY